MSLQPADIVSTGTPPEVGLRLKPPDYLNVGNRICLGILKLDAQTQTVVDLQLL
jgi:5-carboxymethyl-2-hydroxymuconate isomerase